MNNLYGVIGDSRGSQRVHANRPLTLPALPWLVHTGDKLERS